MNLCAAQKTVIMILFADRSTLATVSAVLPRFCSSNDKMLCKYISTVQDVVEKLSSYRSRCLLKYYRLQLKSSVEGIPM